MSWRFLTAALATLCFSGCAHRLAGFKVISTDPNLAIVDPRPAAPTSRVTGEACRQTVTFFSKGKATIEAAVANALEQAPGSNALADAEIENRTLFLLVYAKVCWIVSGIPLTLPTR